jgi:hypothetical protein
LLLLPAFVAACLVVRVASSQTRPGATAQRSPAPVGAAKLAAAAQPAATPAAASSAFARLSGPNLKFHGASTCSSEKCHGAATAAPDPKTRPGDEFTKWSGKDKHNTAYAALSNDRGKQIAAAMKIDAKSQRCLDCHALNVPPKLRADKFSVAEGVTCTACHGPSEKWLEPHKDPGWGNKVRGQFPHDDLLKQTGLYDTRPPVARAEMCTSCHLAIDADMVAAGHPQPVFDLDYFTSEGVYEDRHWRDPKEKYFAVKLWSAGQAVSLRDAMRQLSKRAGGAATAGGAAGAKTLADAYQQAMAHYAAVQPFLAATGYPKLAAIEAQKGQLVAAMTAKKNPEMAKAADALALSARDAIDAVGKAKPDKASTLKTMQGVAQSDFMKSFGQHGQEQQFYAIYSLYGAYANAEAPADADDVTKLIADKLYAEEGKPFAPNDYAANIAAVRAKLPR